MFFGLIYALGWLRIVLVLGGVGLFSLVIGNTAGRVIGLVLLAVSIVLEYTVARTAWRLRRPAP